MVSLKVEEIKAEQIFSRDIYLDKTFLFCPAGCSFSPAMKTELTEWEFKELTFNEDQQEINNQQNNTQPAFQIRKTSEIKKDSNGKIEFEEVSFEDMGMEVEIVQPKKEPSKPAVQGAVKETIQKSTEQITNQGTEQVENSDDASDNSQKPVNSNTKPDRDYSRMNAVKQVYDGYLNYIKNVYTHYATHKEINLTEIKETVKDLCIYIKENKRYMLRIVPTLESKNKNYLISHSMRSTVISITIGLQMRMHLSDLVELGVACILHEIGMIRLPPQLYITDKPLSAAEKNQIATHPVIGYEIIKNLGFPEQIQFGVLEHHERMTGDGYPRHLDGEKISNCARIIAVACSYEAITAPRFHKEARSTYDAMIELLQNKNNYYDQTVVTALLHSLSLFPIGAYVYLSNGKVGQVTDVKANNPKFPIVTILGEKEQNGSPKTAQTNGTNFRIIRVMDKKEASDVIAAMEKQLGHKII